MSELCPTAKRVAVEERQRREATERFAQFRALCMAAAPVEIERWLDFVSAHSPEVAKEIGRVLFFGREARKR